MLRGMRLRPVTAADLRVVVGWLDSPEAVRRWSGPGFEWPLTFDALRLATFGGANAIVWAAELDGRLAGIARLRMLPEPGRGRYGWVLLDPALRGRGLGTDLVRATVRAGFVEHGLLRMDLGVYAHNTAARRVYEALGFARTEPGGDEGPWANLEHSLDRDTATTTLDLGADPIFSDLRGAALYDPLDPDRSDLDHYAALLDELGARSVLDVGCGTGTFALLLAGRGLAVTGVDPAAASLAVARAKPGAERMRWVHGRVADALPLQVDAATMTGNVAQVFLTDTGWAATLRGCAAALRPGGHLVFETRRPERRAWEEWTTPFETVAIPGVGRISTRDEVTRVDGPLVTFRWTIRFPDGDELVSYSTLRFRSRPEVEESLRDAGFEVVDVRDAPDRPGKEWVFVARRRT